MQEVFLNTRSLANYCYNSGQIRTLGASNGADSSGSGSFGGEGLERAVHAFEVGHAVSPCDVGRGPADRVAVQPGRDVRGPGGRRAKGLLHRQRRGVSAPAGLQYPCVRGQEWLDPGLDRQNAGGGRKLGLHQGLRSHGRDRSQGLDGCEGLRFQRRDSRHTD